MSERACGLGENMRGDRPCAGRNHAWASMRAGGERSRAGQHVCVCVCLWAERVGQHVCVGVCVCVFVSLCMCGLRNELLRGGP